MKVGQQGFEICTMYTVHILEIVKMHIPLVENKTLIQLCEANQQPMDRNVGTMM